MQTEKLCRSFKECLGARNGIIITIDEEDEAENLPIAMWLEKHGDMDPRHDIEQVLQAFIDVYIVSEVKESNDAVAVKNISLPSEKGM
ncbi:hypothetical protein NPIL_119981 [Nephila pilipes]|uniref:Uncharacterized protein n=1 Tax=Nephila pilipes TaxID=299642 RepID=A0A8X6QBU0_NEPPI|nr:hypothetical protein NPIL_119981 [Nephila pilipes]